MTQLHTQPTEAPGNGALQPARVPVAVGQRGVIIGSLDELWRFSQAVAKSGLAPKGMEKPETVLVAIQLGLELGLSPMSALQNIGVINGKPGIYGDAALALVRGSGLCESYQQRYVGQGEERKAVVTTKRRGEPDPITTEFSVADAKKAGLWGKAGPWQQYPDRMLLFRSRGFNLRDNFGDVLKGLRTMEELQDVEARRAAVEAQGKLAGPQPARGPAADSNWDAPAPQDDPDLADKQEIVRQISEGIRDADSQQALSDGPGVEMARQQAYLGESMYAALLQIYQEKARALQKAQRKGKPEREPGVEEGGE